MCVFSNFFRYVVSFSFLHLFLFDQFLFTSCHYIGMLQSQFALDQELWTSSIGKGIDDETKMKPWETYLNERTLFDGSSGGVNTSTYVYKRSKDKAARSSLTTSVVRNNAAAARDRANANGISKKAAKATAALAAIPASWKPKVAKTVHVPVVVLLNEWNKDVGATPTSLDPLLSAKVVMKKVDYAMRQLRSSLTVQALQKASIRVAAAMLDLAKDARCYNPLLSIQQAAMFAGQGSKGGNNDEFFKQRLPDHESKCTSLQALLILGRADCLRAVSFTDEAIFLCSYVARICALHRDPERVDYEWTPRWRVVGIQAWLSSTSIDATIASFLNEKLATSVWELHIQKELRCGRRDARAFECAANEMNAPPPFETAAGRDSNEVQEEEEETEEDTLANGSKEQEISQSQTGQRKRRSKRNRTSEGGSGNVDEDGGEGKEEEEEIPNARGEVRLPSFDKNDDGDSDFEDKEETGDIEEDVDGPILAV
jgi:hypothetical protein